MKSLWIAVVSAFSTFSVLPTPRIEWNEYSLKNVLAALPLVGVKIVSGSGTDTDPYVLAPVYGISVTYEANDGIFNTVEGYSVTQYYAQASGGVYVNPIAENPESSGKLFIGWFTDEYGEEKFDFSTPITGSITLYAGWVSI